MSVYYILFIKTFACFPKSSLVPKSILTPPNIQMFRSMKHYFLLDQGDFNLQFFDLAEDELLKDIEEVRKNRLESLLEYSLQTSSVNEDKYKDDVR